MTQDIVPVAAGVVIRVSKIKVLAVLAILCLVIAVGIVAIWAWWTQTHLPLPLFGEPIHRWGGMTGSLMVVMSALFIPIVVKYLFALEKLILADDRMQIVQSNKVAAQIPYRNIARAQLADNEGGEFLGIDLENMGDADTFAEGHDFDDHKKTFGWHYAIQGVYERELADICRSLNDRMAKIRQV
jgi:hypothetical protein